MARTLATIVGIAIVAFIVVKYSTNRATKGPTLQELLEDIEAPQVLDDFIKDGGGEAKIIEVAEGVYSAVNYALAFSYMVVGPDGVVIIDTTESVEAAREIYADFRAISDKPIKAIIYTHHHIDHVAGSRGFVDGMDTLPEVWAHPKKTRRDVRGLMRSGFGTKRVLNQFGLFLGKYRLGQNSMKFRLNKPGVTSLPVTHSMQGPREDISVAGLDLTLVSLPGEAEDMIGVWIPGKRILHIGDDIYTAFPNLYAVRGSTQRDALDWIGSLDAILELRPLCIVGGHLLPVCGEDEVQTLVSEYRAAIKYVHDQTVRYMSKGIHPDEVTRLVRLPAEMEGHQWVREVYGTLPLSVRGIITQYMGWFSGRAEDLSPLGPSQRAQRMLRLVGPQQLLAAADEALGEGDPQWALELASHVHTAQDGGDPEAIRIRGLAMRALAAKQTSINARNYYMTAVMEDAGALPQVDMAKHFLTLPPEDMFQVLTTRLRAEDVRGVDTTVCFRIQDTHTALRVHRRIADVLDAAAGPVCDVTVTSDASTLQGMLTGAVTPLNAAKSGVATVDGSVAKLVEFINYFDLS